MGTGACLGYRYVDVSLSCGVQCCIFPKSNLRAPCNTLPKSHHIVLFLILTTELVTETRQPFPITTASRMENARCQAHECQLLPEPSSSPSPAPSSSPSSAPSLFPHPFSYSGSSVVVEDLLRDIGDDFEFALNPNADPTHFTKIELEGFPVGSRLAYIQKGTLVTVRDLCMLVGLGCTRRSTISSSPLGCIHWSRLCACA